ncbi:hypothetical protein THAOC_08310 [Thalassiosira oceanica]|uniref:Uncharacterized protein n=1 Tax=Thalassiosira oceanica TaxID=159749 RepID=K0TIH3_THAOC|nr:hypothetical protein THAOC_08310 [Thalassiosira oceanica]|eukprot:EJK70337.1 hypothetical protein THAOC_08310 [Thalassiosira oceanica]
MEHPRRPPRRMFNCPWAFFSQTALLAITSYHTNKTRLTEAPAGPVGGDNGPGSEPPPHQLHHMIASGISAVSSGRRKAELSSLQGLLSTSMTRAVQAETVGLATTP